MLPSEEIISGQNLAARCDYVFAQMRDEGGRGVPVFAQNAPALNGGEVVFCKTDYILALHDVLNECVPKHVPFSILTHDSDYPITREITRMFSSRPVRFYGMNMCCNTGHPVPIGVANSYCGITMKGQDLRKSTAPTRLLYVNHRVETYPQDRAWLYPHFSCKNWCTVSQPYPKGDISRYREELLDHKFVLCPRGNGIDTHRLWEALYCGVIPVVVRHRTHSPLEGILPILFVDNYSEVDERLLVECHERFSSTQWNTDALTVSWWMNRIRSEK